MRAIVFDFNGTLSDDEPILCAIFMHPFAERVDRYRPAIVDVFAVRAGVPLELSDPIDLDVTRRCWS